MRRLGNGFALALPFILAALAGCPPPAQIKNDNPADPGDVQGAALAPLPADGDAPIGLSLAPPPPGGKHVPGQFDFYVLSLSWSPQHCATRGKQLGPDDPQCGGSAAYGFIVHGLWPQYERGYPESCATPAELDAGLVQRIMRIMPSQKLIHHEWEKHGTCSGLPPADYFGHAEALFTGLKLPERYSAPKELISTSVAALRKELTSGNPSLPQDGASIAMVCAGESLQELRLCFSKDFKAQACSGEVRDKCPANFTARPLISRR